MVPAGSVSTSIFTRRTASNHSEQQIGSEAAEQLRKWLQTTESDEQHTFSPQFVSMHPAGGHEVCNDHGDRTWIPDKTKWAAPEGTQPPPDINPLAMSLSDICDKGNEIAEMHTSLVNRVGLHKCNGYCLRKRKRSSAEGNVY